MTTENTNIASIIDQIKASQQKVLQAFEDHNSLVNKSLELLQQLKTETKVEVVKVKDPLEELKIVRDEFNKIFLTDTDLEHIKTSSKKWLETTYEGDPKDICRSIGWIESITFKNCQNIKSVTLHFQLFKDEITFKYSLDENSNECILYFGSPDSSHIIDDNTGPEAPDAIHTSMFPINILPYQPIYFTCEKIDETKPCYATMMYGYYDFLVPYKLINRIIFTIQDKKLFTRLGACYPYENENIDLLSNDNKIRGEYLITIIDILLLYGTDKISTSFKEIFLKLFKTILDGKNQGNINQLKERILKVRDIRWLLLEMEKYPQFFQFNEDDLELMKNNGASRDNIYLVKKFLKKDGDYEEYYPEEEGGGIKCQYHMTGGLLNGEMKEWYKNGQLIFQKYFKEGKLDGEYKLWHSNGQLYIQEYYKEGKAEGECKWWYSNGQLKYQDNYKGDKREGEYKQWYEDGKLMVQKFYKEGKLEGEMKEWHRNGQLWSQKYWKEDKLEGEMKEWYKNGQLWRQCYYKEGKLEGEAKWWHSNGQLFCQENYKEGTLEGEFKKWNEEGNLIEYKIYREGEIIEDLLALE